MADLRASYPSLEDAVTGAGLALHKVLQGDALAAKNASAALIAKNVGGQLRYPIVNAQDELIVSTQGGSLANLSDNGNVAGNASTYQTIVTIPLQAAFSYKNLKALVHCYRDARFKVVLDDNGTPVILAQGMSVTAGDSSDNLDWEGFSFDSGATGTQNLLLQGLNQNSVSDLGGTLAIDEVQP